MGADILLRSDVEFDLGAGKVRFFKPDHCEGAQVVYWSKPASVLPMTAFKRNRIEVQVRVGPIPVTAFMDTGADISVITPAAAALAGVMPRSQGVSSDEPSVGIGPQRVATLVAVFPSFSFGDETIRNAKLRIADMFTSETKGQLGSLIPASVADFPRMLLGADFFRSHRVYVSKAQSKVYVSYVGGPVFETRSPPRTMAPTPRLGEPAGEKP